MVMQNPTGAASSSPVCSLAPGSDLAPGGSVRTRSDLQRLVTISTNSLEVKTELMDTLDPHTDKSGSANYDFNDDEVFCLSRQPVSGAGGSSSTNSGADTGTGNGTGGGPNSSGTGSENSTNRTNIFQTNPVHNPAIFQAKSDNNSAVMGHFGRGYNAVRAARKAASCLRQLNPAPRSIESSCTGSFLTGGDARALRTKVGSNINTRINLSASFDPAGGRCISCMGGGHDAFSDAAGGPVALVASDQAFPACLPVWRGGGSACELFASRTPRCAS